MQRVANYVQAHLADRIPVATLAKEARLSPSHFNVLFKATTDLTCEQYILRTRLARAKALIETGTYTVGQVAHMTGFSDHSHLTVRFTKFFGAPPRSFLPAVRTV
jgi:transcriptional regulator GlxA family with amidase domain